VYLGKSGDKYFDFEKATLYCSNQNLVIDMFNGMVKRYRYGIELTFSKINYDQKIS